MAEAAVPRVLLTFVVSVSLLACVNGNLMRLFAANPPDFVNVSDLKSSIRSLVANVTNRLRCDEHGLEHAECVKCLNTDDIVQLLKLDPLSKSLSRSSAEDLSVFIVHQVLYFESMCISLSRGCVDLLECQGEVFHAMEGYSTPKESLVKVLRIFKLYLKEEGEKECFSAEDVLQEMPFNLQDLHSVDEKRQVFSIVMGRIFRGQCVDIGESTTDFLDDIFHHYGDSCSPYMTLEGLKRMILDLQNGKGARHDHGHNHLHHHDNDHEHDHQCSHESGHFAHHHNHAHDHDHPNHEHYHDANSHHDSHDHHSHAHHHDHDLDQHHDHHLDDHVHNHVGSIDTEGPDSTPEEKVSGSSSVANVHTSSVPSILPSSDTTTRGSSSTASVHQDVSTASVHQDVSTASVHQDVSTTSSPLDLKISNSSFLNLELHNSTFELSTMEVQQPSTDNVLNPNVSVPSDEAGSLTRITRSTLDHKELHAPPSASLRSDLSHKEDESKTEEHRELLPQDDVKKVYLLHNDNHHQGVDLEMSNTPHQFAHLASKCLSAEGLIRKFGHQENSTLSKSDFMDLCPALIQQIVSGVCTDSGSPSLQPLPTRMEVYGYGSLSVFIISLTSLAGVFLLPIMTKHAYNYIIAGFYGLAFSTLAADALLHLMPQFLGLHTHGPGDDHGHSHEDGGFLEPYAQLQLGVFFTIYGLFLFEAIMGILSNGEHHSHGQENKGHGHSHSHLPDELPTLISVKSKSETQLTCSRDLSTSSIDTEVVEVEAMKKPPNLMVTKPLFLGLTSLAIVVTLGDSVHNFGDGLAIGAAFSNSVRGGLSTAIAIFCHELPHEFGDFVVLLSTGLSFQKAMWINFLSGLTCFAGLYIGIFIGDNEAARKWVMAVTAGIFLYVALGEMLPELREHTHGSRVKMLLVKNVGILAGIAIMLLISVYEEQIA